MPQHGRAADFGNRPLWRRGHADIGRAGRGIEVLDVSGAEGKAALFGAG